MGMKYSSLNCRDHRLREGLAKDCSQMLEYSFFRPFSGFPFRQNIECKLTCKNLALQVLKVQKVYCLFLELVHACVASLRRRFEHRDGRCLQPKCVVQGRQNSSQNNRGRVRI